ncbi:hypothetical protein VHEMI01972 [[Torrubiella] hemipterigena]|uniref:Uncharacterized protein n=1 Tax=[Torrubiella] hemipterigena TaxID=1531966 RepID=A0A0A1T6T7_9HYPO|nr:hypothetical protein VHEMI01972 [[Torrubiella] hemipterigena]
MFSSVLTLGMATKAAASASMSLSGKNAAGEDNSFDAYQWIGFDGVENCQTLLQAGTSARLIDGKIKYEFWYEFFPEMYQISLPVSPGNNVYVEITATSRTSDEIYLLNESTGENISYNVTTPHEPLCLNHAVWVHENPNFLENSPYWSKFTISDAFVTDEAGRDYDLAGAEGWYLSPDTNPKNFQCHPEVGSSTDVKIVYHGQKPASQGSNRRVKMAPKSGSRTSSSRNCNYW